MRRGGVHEYGNSVRILITGSTGLLGQALNERLAPTGEVLGLSRHAPTAPQAAPHEVCDLTDARRTTDLIQGFRPDVVIHTQAFSNVDACEQDPGMADAMNVQATAHVVAASRMTRAQLVYVSTDYVFDGTKGRAYDETDVPNPLSVYGRSKLQGERLTLDYAEGIVVRPSTLFGPARMNFCDHIVSRVRDGQSVEAFRDQVTSPTYTEDLAEGIGELARVLRAQGGSGMPPSRVVHMTNAGSCSRVEFAQRLVDLLGGSRQLIQAIRIADQQRPAPRPACSALTTRYLSAMIGRTLRPWDVALEAYLRGRQWLN